MTEDEWLAATDPAAMRDEIWFESNRRKLLLFAAACCHRACRAVPDGFRRRVVRMTASPLSPGPAPADVWETVGHAAGMAERFADGGATEEQVESAATAARTVRDHFWAIAAAAPLPGEDPGYDDAAVTVGWDVAAATDSATGPHPAACQCSARVVASVTAFDEAAYHSGRQGRPVVAPDHPYITALRHEHEGQADLIRCVFGNPFRPVAADPRWLT